MARTVTGFVSALERDDHFKAHGGEFSPAFLSATAYEATGIAFLSGPLGATMTEGVRRNGDIIRFEHSTDEFAICDRYGTLKTYYRPDPAIHKEKDNLTYFREQCRK